MKKKIQDKQQIIINKFNKILIYYNINEIIKTYKLITLIQLKNI